MDKEQLEAIEKANRARFWFGFCQNCKGRIEAKLDKFPTKCPYCGHEPSN